MAGLVPAMTFFADGGAQAGEIGAKLFETCRACHTLDPAVKGMAGPNLSGLLRRRIAGDKEFDYSPVLRQAAATGTVWTRERLEIFLADPEAMFPAMWMSSMPMRHPGERKALADFLVDPKSR
jgi:cytochrome c